jgi:hypothetical protein
MKKISKILVVLVAASGLFLTGCSLGGLDRDNKTGCGFVCINGGAAT